MTFVTSDATRRFPVLGKGWGYVNWDSVLPYKFEGYTLVQVEDFVQRDNFGILSDNHYFPLPTTTEFPIGLGKAIFALATNLRTNWLSVSTPSNLITLLSSSTSSPGNIVPTPRAYHTDESGEYVVKEIPMVNLMDENSPKEYTVPPNDASRSDASPEDAVVKVPKLAISKK